MQQGDAVFAGSVPQMYERYMVPMLFEPYAEDLLERLEERSPSRILEIAAGTGVVTRAMAAAFPAGVTIVATDLNPGMLEQARGLGTSRPVEWRVADAMALPFPEGSFDAVVCQFGCMFFPDKAKAFAEIHRVLAPAGSFLFSVWDAMEVSEFADVVMRELGRMFPNDPPRFMERTPHGYRDPAVIARDLAAAGFTASPHVSVVSKQSHAPAARDAAFGYCQGTPVRGEIEARDAARLDEATERATRALTERFGPGPIVGRMQALVVSVER